AGGTFLDFGDIICVIKESGDTVIISSDGTNTRNCGDKLTPTAGGFNGVMYRTVIIVDGDTDIDGWAAVGDLYINNAKDISDVPVTGDLYIDTKTGQNEVVSYANVKVSGVVYNPSLYNIEIHADANCELTADNPGTGAGQIYIVEGLITLNVNVKDNANPPVAISDALVYIDEDLDSGGSIANTTTDTNGDITQADYVGAVTTATLRVRKYGYKSYIGTVSLTVDTITSITLIPDPQQI
ncbi:MAG: hypothetical protein GY810_28360, partial [Aureispira sp.]|nr:hypothetical protein [Aureispira sp.]